MNRLFNIFRLSVVCLSVVTLVSCLGNDDNRQSVTFNNMAVTVSGNELEGYRLYTDFDAVLVPSNLSQISWLKEVRRAVVSFDTSDESLTNVSDLESGHTYDIVLSEAAEIPTYISCVDTLSEDYQIFGQDSIALKNKAVQSVNQTEGQYYIQNGYMNVVPTFYFDPYSAVSFLLYYDGNRDIDTTGKKATFNLYFDNNAPNAWNTTSSLISLRMPDEVYSRFIQTGLTDDDTIDVCLNVRTQTGTVTLEYKTALEDFMLP